MLLLNYNLLFIELSTQSMLFCCYAGSPMAWQTVETMARMVSTFFAYNIQNREVLLSNLKLLTKHLQPTSFVIIKIES